MTTTAQLEFMECDEGYFRHELPDNCYTISYLGNEYLQKELRQELYEVYYCDVVNDEPESNCILLDTCRDFDTAVNVATIHFNSLSK